MCNRRFFAGVDDFTVCHQVPQSLFRGTGVAIGFGVAGGVHEAGLVVDDNHDGMGDRR